MIQIAPSMLAADFLHLEKDVELVNEHADLFHLDIMDGTFVPNISYGFPVVEAIARKATKPLDAHLMIVHPEKYVDRPAPEDSGPSPTCTEARARAGGGQAETVVRFLLQNSGGHGGSGHGWSITSPSRI